MKNALKKLIVMLLAVALLVGICSVALAEEETAVTGNESISIGRVNKGDVYYGDEVTLMAYVKNVAGSYSVVWEQLTPDRGWVKVGTGESYSFIVTEATADAEFRAVLVLAD